MDNKTISKLSKVFLKEAKSSPQMLEDLASMEKYMSESYNGRIFIELLQNADDARSTSVIVDYVDNTLIVANNGRVFDENDLNAICRSGSSRKKRGKNIGYRGIGFKSTTNISTEIIIYSNETFFSFSKKVCADKLGLSIDNVPTIRIPFLYDLKEISKEEKKIFDKYKKQGYTTFFIFKNANIEKFISEITDIDNDWILFLNNVSEVYINLKQFTYDCSLSRINLNNKYNLIKFKENNEKWLIVNGNKGASLAFKYDEKLGIIPCKDEEAVFHCYLPTLDTTGFAFKINGDFSTDPSRKHIIKDDITNKVLEEIAYLFSRFIEEVVKEEDKMGINAITLLNKRLRLGNLSISLEERLLNILSETKWIKLQDGKLVYPKDVNIFPKWINGATESILIENIHFFKKNSVSLFIRSSTEHINNLLNKLGAKDYKSDEFLNLLEDKISYELISIDILSTILANVIKLCTNKNNVRNCIVILQDNSKKKISDIIEGDRLLDEQIKKIKEIVLNQEIIQLCNILEIPESSFKIKEEINYNKSFINNNIFEKFTTKHSIAKWRTAEENCIKLEEHLGNDAKDVSKQNLGYDIISYSANKECRYIEVKLLKKLGDSFVITNNEYTAAHQYKEKYYICLIVQSQDFINAIYIKNPLEYVKFEKRVKSWEWLCDEYSGEKIELSY